MGWSCTACTFRNANNSAKECFTCGTARVTQKGKTSIDLTGSDDDNEKHTATAGTSASEKRTAKKRGSGTQRTLLGGVVDDATLKSEKAAKKPRTTKAIKAEASSLKSSSAAPSKRQSITHTTLSQSASSAAYRPIIPEPYRDRNKRCVEILKNVFGAQFKLRNQQPHAVHCALKNQSQVIVMATGGGKSLCYQLPSLVIGGTTVVISPLIALMHDQVDALVKKGVAAACINSSNKESENALVLDRLLGRSTKMKTGLPLQPVSIVYVTPESLQTHRFQAILQELNEKKRLAGFAIDEAHCLSSWGHDFRPAYRKLDYIPRWFPKVPCMALTATATPAVIADIQKILNLEKAPCHIGSFDRPNIFYKVHYKDGLEAIQAGGSLIDLAKFVQKQHKRAKKDGNKPCSGIVYVHKRDDTTFLAREVTKRTNIKAVAYHGALKMAERTQAQEDWTSGEAPIVIATISFGMGIDLAHVRYVVHWAIPKTMDGFYQESGRAGRDGLPAFSLVYFSRDDAQKFAYLINMQEQNRKEKSGEREVSASAERKHAALQLVVDFCMTPHCRRQFVLKHFGEKETDPKTVCQKSCDYCNQPEKIKRAIESSDAMRAISRQKKEGSKKKTQVWNGQWDRPHGDDSFFEAKEKDWEVDGLGITGEAKGRPSFVGTGSFESAKTLASKLDTLEAMEMQENKSNGFVQFKSVKRKERDHYPDHIKAQLVERAAELAEAETKPKERSSSEIAASADKLRAELAAIQAKRKALQNRNKK